MAAEPHRQNGAPDADELDFRPTPPWSRAAQAVAAVLWPSFLAASFASMLFFAFVDPELLGQATTPAMDLSRMTGYAIGFFFFWLVTLVSSAISVYLVQTAHMPPAPAPGQDERGE